MRADAARRSVRLQCRCPSAGEVLHAILAGCTRATAADVYAHDAAVLMLPLPERQTLRWALVERVDPEGMAALRPLFGRPEPPKDPPWRDVAAFVRHVRDRAANLHGWRPGSPLPLDVAQAEVAGPAFGRLGSAEQSRARGVLAGMCACEPDDLFSREARPSQRSSEAVVASKAVPAFQALRAGTRRLVVSTHPKRRAAGAAAAAQEGMSPTVLAAVLEAAGITPHEAVSLARWAAARAREAGADHAG